MNYDLIREATRLLLKGLEVDVTGSDFVDTPTRVSEVYREMFEPEETSWAVFDEDYTDMVLVRGHVMFTLCPHHLLPVRLVISLAYLPEGRVLGASKLIRVMHAANSYPRTQEALTSEILCQLRQKLGAVYSAGEAILVRGTHGCMQLRGVRTSADLTTLRFAGKFEEDRELQSRFLDLVKACPIA